jgi:hypothetical protein
MELLVDVVVEGLNPFAALSALVGNCRVAISAASILALLLLLLLLVPALLGVVTVAL